MFIFTDMETLVSTYPSKSARLSGASRALLFLALDLLDCENRWKNADGTRINQAQWDMVQGWLATTAKELMMSDIGAIVPFFTDILPPHVLLCDGTEYQMGDYPELWAVMPVSFLTASGFVTPNLSGKFLYGVTPTINLGDTGGESAVTLTEAQLPTHAHGIGGAATALAVSPGELPVLAPSLPATTSYAGSGMAHNNIPPFVAVKWGIVAK